MRLHPCAEALGSRTGLLQRAPVTRGAGERMFGWQCKDRTRLWAAGLQAAPRGATDPR